MLARISGVSGLVHGFAALFLCIGLTLPGAATGAKKEMSDAEAEAFLAAPTDLISETVARVIAVLNQKGLESLERRERIELIAFDVFDFATMGKLVLARGWKKFDAEQQVQFIDEFKLHLSRNYGSRLDRYQQTDVEVFDSRVEPRNDVTVRSKVIGGQFDGIEMNYRLRMNDDRWRVIDVVIEGVSLVANFRSQFKEVVSKGGPDLLLEQMREKNAAPRDDSD
jgi:phospholipid transport system substrate-binding protein